MYVQSTQKGKEMKRFILIAMILFCANSLKSQEFKFLPMKYDAPNTINGTFANYSIFKYDKVKHFSLHAAMVLINPIKKYDLDLWCSVAFGVGYEIYDGFDHKRTLGFSWTDLIFDVSGAITGVWLKDMLHSRGIYVLIDKRGITFNWRL